MWKVKNQNAATRRSKTASDKKESVEYCYQEWVAPTRWIVHIEPKGFKPTQTPYRNPKKEK